MALTKKRTHYDPQMGLVEACAYYNNVFEGLSAQFPDQSLPEPYIFDEHHKAVTDEANTSEKAGGFVKNSAMSRCSSLSSPSSTSSTGYFLTHQPEEAHSVINFRTGFKTTMPKNEPFLSFDQNDQVMIPQNSYPKIIQQDDWSIWEDDLNCVRSTGFHDCVENTVKENPHGGDQPFGFGWLDSEANGAIETIHQEFGTQEPCLDTGESIQALKKQCTSATRKPRPKSAPSKDPQSVAAKNRRERISERLKILQELVPNGSKVDLVTMLEKAISYVKFLQLQVKVLATDEFWPAQGGKAPDLSQVKEAIDAILSSQKDRNSSSE